MGVCICGYLLNRNAQSGRLQHSFCHQPLKHQMVGSNMADMAERPELGLETRPFHSCENKQQIANRLDLEFICDDCM